MKHWQIYLKQQMVAKNTTIFEADWATEAVAEW